MSITKATLRNRHAIWALVIAAGVFGALGYARIPVRLFPETAPPLVNVVTPWAGASAADVDQSLGRELEEEFASLEGVARISATAQDNLSLVTVEFQYGTDVQMAAVEVQNAIARIQASLPPTAEQSRVMTFSTADRPVYTVGVAGDDPIEARRRAEDDIAPRLQQIPGVAAVDVFGGRVPTVLVEVDPAAAEAHHLPLQRVAQTLAATNVSLPAGRLRGEARETLLRVDERADRAEGLESVPIPMPGGGQIHLDDVATVTRGAVEDDAWFAIGDKRAIAVQVFRTSDANTVEVVRKVQAVIDELKETHPDLTFIEGEESATFTEQSVSNLLSNVWQALLLASVILFLFLGRARSSLITLFTMPLSYGITFALMHALGLEFNMVTLSAVILAVGMVVDASVVVLENIIRLRDEEGLSPMEAAVRGTDEVRMPVLAGVATTLVVLVPLLNLQGFVGRVFAPLATTLLIAFLSSVLVALFVVPVLSLFDRKEGRLEELARRAAGPFQRAMHALSRGYARLLEAGLRHPWVVVLAAVLSFGLGALGMSSAGMDVLPKMDSGAFSISLETSSGTSLQETSRIVQEVAGILEERPEVELVQAQAGYEPGMKFTGGGGVMGPTQGYLSVTLTPRTERETTIWEIEDWVRERMDVIPGIARYVVKEVGNTAKPTTVAPIVVRLTGPDPLVLDHLGDQVVTRLENVDGLVQPIRTWYRDLARLKIHVDPLLAGARGESVASVARTLAMGAEGIPAGSFEGREGSPEPIRVRYQRSDKPEAEDMLSWPLFLSGGQVVPVRSVATAEPVVEQGLFTRENLASVLEVHAELSGRPLSDAVADTQKALASMTLPEGYRLSLEGENNDLIASRSEIMGALGISVLAVYLLLVAQFRSFVHPVTVMMSVPLSLSGVAAALWIAGKPVSMPVMVGLILLVGTVVNNAIILVDIIRNRREAGEERHAAIREGVRARFRPILMTSLSTVVGMLPLAMEWALGAERFSPLAVAVIGGMLASTLLTLVVIPVFYDLSERITTRLGWTRKAATAGALVLAVLMIPGGFGEQVQAAEQAPVVATSTDTETPATPSVDDSSTLEQEAESPTSGTEPASSAPGQTVDLEEAWRLLWENHPSLEAADERLKAAKAQNKAMMGRMLPQVEVQTRYSRMSYVEAPTIEIPMAQGASVQLGESLEDYYSFRVTAQQPVFTGGALLNGKRAAKAGVALNEAERDRARSQLWSSLSEAWYRVLLTRELVEVQQSLRDATVAQEARVQRLHEQGRATDLQLSSVALRRAEVEEALADAEAAAEMALRAFQSLVGSPVDAATQDLVALAEAVAVEAATAFDGPGQAPDLRRAEAARDVAQAQARVARAAMAPSLALRFGYQYENPNTRYFPLEDAWHDSWDASIVLGWKLGAGVQVQEARAARARARAASSAVQAVRTQLNLQEEQARVAIVQGTRKLALARERVQVAHRSVQAADTALNAGRATALDLLEREADLARARAAQQKAACDVLIARERLRVLMGAYGPEKN